MWEIASLQISLQKTLDDSIKTDYPTHLVSHFSTKLLSCFIFIDIKFAQHNQSDTLLKWKCLSSTAGEAADRNKQTVLTAYYNASVVEPERPAY